MEHRAQNGLTYPARPKSAHSSEGLNSLLAGALAGAIEISITYPAEFAKTRAQLNRRLPQGQKLPWPPFGKAWYAGYTTLLLGSTVKAGLQFAAFDQIKKALAGGDEKVSTGRNVLAGLGAGIVESIFAVTPMESVKVKLIDDRKRPNPRMRGLFHGSTVIFREHGIQGFFNGLVPTTARQSVNAAIKFTSYSKFKELAEARLPDGEKLGAFGTFGIGSLTGLCSVCISQPLDVVKTRMQSLESARLYGSSLNCVRSLYRHEGLKVFWSGSLPRLARLSLTSGIMFTVYENTIKYMKQLEDDGLNLKSSIDKLKSSLQAPASVWLETGFLDDGVPRL